MLQGNMMLVHEGLPEGGEMLHGNNIMMLVHEGLPERGNVAR